MIRKLSARHIQIIKLLAEGLPTKQIAQKLFISDRTVQNHVYNARQLYNCPSIANLVSIAYKLKIIPLMQRNTVTTLGLLRIGDRFCFPGKTDVWQLVNFIGKGKAAINQFGPGGSKRMHYYDQIKSTDTRVKFLRHTVLEFADEVPVEALQPGDVFVLIEDILTEYQVREQFTDGTKECKAFKVSHPPHLVFIPHSTEVIYLRKAKN